MRPRMMVASYSLPRVLGRWFPAGLIRDGLVMVDPIIRHFGGHVHPLEFQHSAADAWYLTGHIFFFTRDSGTSTPEHPDPAI